MFADACHFDGGQIAVLAEGQADIVLRDCTLGPGEPSIWFDNTRSQSPLGGDLRLTHTSILSGAEPVFRFDGGSVRVWVDDSVDRAGRRRARRRWSWSTTRATCPGAAGPTSMAASARTWRISGKGELPEPITEFARWRETPTELRETGTTVATALGLGRGRPARRHWRPRRDNPTRVFLLSASVAANGDVGARQGPFGSVLKNARPEKRSRLPATRRRLAAAARGGPKPARPRRSAQTAESSATPTWPCSIPCRSLRRPASEPAAADDPMNLPADAAPRIAGASRAPASDKAAAGETATVPATRSAEASSTQPPSAARSANSSRSPRRSPRGRRRRRDSQRRAAQGTAREARWPGRRSLRIAAGPTSSCRRSSSKEPVACRSRPNQARGGRGCASGRRRPRRTLRRTGRSCSTCGRGSLHLEGVDLIVIDQDELPDRSSWRPSVFCPAPSFR